MTYTPVTIDRRKGPKLLTSITLRYRDLLGIKTDNQIAAMAGVSRQCVHALRTKLGIPPSHVDGRQRKKK
jgi:hypothetical protein